MHWIRGIVTAPWTRQFVFALSVGVLCYEVMYLFSNVDAYLDGFVSGGVGHRLLTEHHEFHAGWVAGIGGFLVALALFPIPVLDDTVDKRICIARRIVFALGVGGLCYAVVFVLALCLSAGYWGMLSIDEYQEALLPGVACFIIALMTFPQHKRDSGRESEE